MLVRFRALVQLASLGWSDEVGVGRQGCCTFLPYLYGLALEDGEVVGRDTSPAARMLTIMLPAWQEACDSRWSSFVIFPGLTEQRRNRPPTVRRDVP
jgi:hypothetical protein